MTEHVDAPPTVNGRVTQRDLYDAIGGLRSEQQAGFADIKREVRDLGERVRGVEMQQIKEESADTTRSSIVRDQQDIKREQGVSRRWLAGVAIMVGLQLVTTLVALFAR